MKEKGRWLSLGLGLASAAIAMLSQIVENQRQEEFIERKVEERLAAREENKES